jgi:hypothetical protein
LDGKVDDLIPTLSVEVRTKLEQFRVKLFQAIEQVSDKAIKVVNEIKEQDLQLSKKDFVAKVKPHYDPIMFSLYSKLFDGKPADKALIEILKGNCTVKNFEPVRTVFGLQDLNFYRTDPF